ncbi:hypothetical protein [Gordonia terrae]|uniref:hypothetical protein n=1 Tax=Gordonia terrae TaxID=2055 RepID=UPI003F6C0B5D
MDTSHRSRITHLGAAAAACAALTGIALGSPAVAHASPAIPSGYYQGDVPGQPIANTLWYGKNFTGSSVVNDTAIGWAFPGAVYPGRSVQDGAPVIVVDYSGTPLGFVRDELRPDGRGGYWGRALTGTTELTRFHLIRP